MSAIVKFRPYVPVGVIAYIASLYRLTFDEAVATAKQLDHASLKTLVAAVEAEG